MTYCETIEEEFYEYQVYYSAGGIWSLLLKWIEDGAQKPPHEMAIIFQRLFNFK